MKKFVKMSMAAAVTLAGLSSNVGATTLADVANNVDVFGYVNLRYEDRNTETNTGNAADDDALYLHKEVLGATGKVNDDISYMFAGANLSSNSTNSSIGYQGFLMVYSYFTYTGIKDTSISAGRQGLDTPLTVVYDPATATSEANGVSLTTKFAGTTLNAAYYASTNFDLGDTAGDFPGTAISGGESYANIGLTSKLGAVTLDAWYATMQDRYDSYTIGASADLKVGNNATISPFARYTAADIDGVDADHSLWKAGIESKFGPVGVDVAYGQTDEEGGWVTFDEDAEANLEGWQIGLLGNADAKLMTAGINVDATSKINLSANYATMEVGNNDEKEVYGAVKYQMTNNISATVTLGQVDIDGESDKRDIGRVQVLWFF